jgi:lipoate---protein ligase
VSAAHDAAEPGELPGDWHVRRLRGAASRLHAEPVPQAATRAAWVLEADAPALVLGSTQGDEIVDAAAVRARGVPLVRRRSGGGVVWVDPATTAWVDVVVPAGDPLWDDDVGRAAVWVGRAWQATLADLGVAPTEVHDGPLACGPLGRLVCFATVGSGEVTTPDGRKVVGISQRRTRSAARFQCATYSRWDAGPLVDLLRLDADGAAALADPAVGTGVAPAAVVAAFLRHLPD